MLSIDREYLEKHLSTHSERSNEDRAAIAILETFLRSNGKINTAFSADDKWPNHDGTFEFVENPDVSRRPKQNFFVQIKGTHVYTEQASGGIKYSLKSLAFPAYICSNVSFDPGILFVVLNPDQRGKERVFWKYMSVSFLNAIKFEQSSITIEFTSDDEVLNTDESVTAFCNKINSIVDHHSFINHLDSFSYSRSNIEKIIEACDTVITESIDRFEFLNDSRESVSRRILTKLYDLCTSALILNALDSGATNVNLPLAWEQSLLNIETKYLCVFLKGLDYLGRRIPEDGQSERLMLKYYDFLWQIRKFLHEKFSIEVLSNLEKFPLDTDEVDHKYYELVAKTVEASNSSPGKLRSSRFFVQKKVPFFVGRERYYEVTFQLAGAYASKYNRITAYTKKNISTNYAVQISYTEESIDLWGIDTKIKIITNWQVSIDPTCLNKLGKIIKMPTRISSQYGEYHALMAFLSKTGLNFLELVDLQESTFNKAIDEIFKGKGTSTYKDVLIRLKENFSKTSNVVGHNVIRYLLLELREEVLESVMPSQFNRKLLCDELYLSSRCLPFERNPFVSNLVGNKTHTFGLVKHLIDVAGHEKVDVVRPYLFIEGSTKRTGEIYFEIPSEDVLLEIKKYNESLDDWEREQGYQINDENGFSCIASYEQSTLFILQKLLDLSKKRNKGQREYNSTFLKQGTMDFADDLKKLAIQNVFVNSRLLLIYGAAGTGKTTLINCISNLMTNQRKLFLTKTHTALQNLKRRIENPGTNADFVSIDSFTKRINLPDYDVIFVDECSTIDNRTMQVFLRKMNPDTFVVLAGDVHQIESIEFGNWFFYAKELICTEGANVELLSTWRTKKKSLIGLWHEVRKKDPLITEKLVLDGPFSEEIGPRIFEQEAENEVILCLNYDGKFGLNNMNNYFQAANTGKAVSWKEWTYKIGDPILFNENKRFSLLYNNLKGRIANIEKESDKITFTVDVDIPLTEMACERDGLTFIEALDGRTRISFDVFSYSDDQIEADESLRLLSVIPFQLAYAVSIHKAQGLEYDSVKVVIPGNTAEKITHGIFYTAITRAKQDLKIFWSSETMQAVVKAFSEEDARKNSLDIIRRKLGG